VADFAIAGFRVGAGFAEAGVRVDAAAVAACFTVALRAVVAVRAVVAFDRVAAGRPVATGLVAAELLPRATGAFTGETARAARSSAAVPMPQVTPIARTPLACAASTSNERSPTITAVVHVQLP